MISKWLLGVKNYAAASMSADRDTTGEHQTMATRYGVHPFAAPSTPIRYSSGQ